jgi:hypothetical protein
MVVRVRYAVVTIKLVAIQLELLPAYKRYTPLPNHRLAR